MKEEYFKYVRSVAGRTDIDPTDKKPVELMIKKLESCIAKNGAKSAKYQEDLAFYKNVLEFMNDA